MPKPSETIDLAIELIEKPSVSPKDEGCQAILSTRLKNLGFEIESMNCGNVSNLWAKKGYVSPHLTFVGHTDVVPVGKLSDWSHPPFSPTIEKGMLYGRGAADMKGSIAAMVTACERFCSKFPNFQGSLSFLITSDEESVAIEGTKVVIEKLMKRSEQIDYCLVGEPTCEIQLGDTVKVGRRGSLTAKITVNGKQGHVAYPQHADNPIHKAGKLIDGLASLEWRDGDSVFPNSTLHISNIAAGVGVDNVIPADLELIFNIRHSPATSAQSLMDRVKSLCEELKLDYTINWYGLSNPYYTREDSFAKVVSSSIRDLTGVGAEVSASGGTSDGRFVAKTGAQVVEFGPLNSTIHKVNECVSTHDLNLLSDIYARILEYVFINDELPK